ncbi:MAG: hypothetical protein WCG48_04010 [Candidatus Berkelbacteria bacterium]
MIEDEIVIEEKASVKKTKEPFWKNKIIFRSIVFSFLVLVVLGTAAGVYFWKFGNLKKVVEQVVSPSYDFPVYSTIQDGKFKLVAYNINTKKQYEIFSSASLEASNFAAGIPASKDLIAYADKTGVYEYNLSEKKSTTLIQNTTDENAQADLGSSGYTNLNWSPDASRLAVGGTRWNSQTVSKIINTSNNQVTELGDTLPFSWLAEANKYVLGSQSTMQYASNLSYGDATSSAIKKIFPAEPIAPGANSVAAVGDTVYYIGTTYISDQAGSSDNKIMSVKVDGTGQKEYLTDKTIAGNIVYDGVSKLYFAKKESSTNYRVSGKGLGVYSMTLDGVISKVVDTEDPVVPVMATEKELVLTSTASAYIDESSISKLSIYNLADKTSVQLGEAKVISFAGYIKSNLLPTDMPEVAPAVPTAAETEDYLQSQKTQGSVYDNYYDYCWDYNCNSMTYPYAALTSSERPEIVTFNSSATIKKLNSKITIPVVFLVRGDIDVPAYDLNYFKNAENKNSVEILSSWFNTQSQKYGSVATMNFSYKDEVVHLPTDDSCSTYIGTSKYISHDCAATKIFEKYPDLKNSENIMIVPFSAAYLLPSTLSSADRFANYFDSYTFSQSNTNFIIQGSSYGIDKYAFVASTTSSSSSSWSYILAPEKDFIFSAEGQYNRNANNFFSVFLAKYGAKDKRATYKAPSGSSGCLVDPTNDVMCGSSFVNGSITSPTSLSDLVIGPITSKELGWYDADGDKIKEVNDVCPFNKANNCKQ